MAKSAKPPPQELPDPFHSEQGESSGWRPHDTTTPGIAGENLAPATEPAPAPHPDTLSEAHGFPRERRCAQE